MFLLLGKPQKTAYSNNKEVFNEFTILFMGYFVLSFTGAEPDPEKRAQLGRCLIFISMSNITFHLIFLLIDSIKKLIKFLRNMVKKIRSKCKREKPMVELYLEPESK